MSQYFQALALCVIHQKQRNAIVHREIAHGHQLTISAKIRKADCSFRQDAQKSLRSASMLDVRPPRFADRRNIKAVSRLNECNLLPRKARQFIGRRNGCRTTKVGLLSRENTRRERDLTKAFRHIHSVCRTTFKFLTAKVNAAPSYSDAYQTLSGRFADCFTQSVQLIEP